MRQQYIYLAGLCEFKGEPLILVTPAPATDKTWLLLKVVDAYGEYGVNQLVEMGSGIEYKRAQATMAELNERCNQYEADAKADARTCNE